MPVPYDFDEDQVFNNITTALKATYKSLILSTRLDEQQLDLGRVIIEITINPRLSSYYTERDIVRFVQQHSRDDVPVRATIIRER